MNGICFESEVKGHDKEREIVWKKVVRNRNKDRQNKCLCIRYAGGHGGVLTLSPVHERDSLIVK
jgi:hypothetical protein